MGLRQRLAGTRRGAAVGAVVGGVLVLVLAVSVAALLAAPRDAVLTGTYVDERHVGELTRAELVAVVDELADRRLDQELVVEGERDTVELTHGDAGLAVDRARIVEDAWDRGRGFPAGWWERLTALVGATADVPLHEEVRDERVEAAAADAADALSEPARDAAVTLDTGPDGEPQVSVTEPAPGERVDADQLADRIAAWLERPEPGVIEAPGETEQPDVTRADLDPAEERARAAVAAPVELEHPADGDDLVLAPGDLARLLAVEPRPDAPRGDRLALTIDVAELETHARDVATELDVDPVEADIRLVEGEIRITGGTAGYRFDAEAVGEQVLELTRHEEDRSATLAGPRPEPERTREDAEALGISEEVSSFTTEYECCPPRVTNIQRIAELVDGALIPQGERFSLNEHVGPRTAERGFVPGGAIIDGEFVDVVGGGVSQFATTFFNAAFFSGIELVEFQPHSYYFPRYPAGREATISYNVIDVVVANDSPYGILVEATATDTAVTVTFWSSAWAEVEAFDSGPYNIEPGAVRDGFDIDFGRVVTYPDGATQREEWFHRYQPQD